MPSESRACSETVIRPQHQIVGLLVLVAVCYCAAAAGGAATAAGVRDWYLGLKKPPWTPPDWVFGPVWTVLYASMGVAAWLVWRREGLAAARLPMVLFGIQLVLNAAWSWLFFGLRSPGLAFLDIVLLTAAIAATSAAFWRRSVLAGALLMPYLGWVTFAGVLNYAIWKMNA